MHDGTHATHKSLGLGLGMASFSLMLACGWGAQVVEGGLHNVFDSRYSIAVIAR